jgi:hypothetical protein
VAAESREEHFPAVPREIIVRIRHREPVLTQTMLLVTADGVEQQLTFTYETNGDEVTNATTAGDVQSRAYWRGSELIIDSELRTAPRVFHFRDHWSLSPDGETLQMAHRDDDLAEQVAILEKAVPDLAVRFR